MSIPINSSINLKTLSKAVSFAVFAGFSSYSQAVDFGKTTIFSKQYEPLNASIDVKEIDGTDFDVAMANNSIYQQMGLNASNKVSAHFVRTSASTGKIVLTTSIPVNDPFADIVLKIKDNGSKRFMPKTLLMPVGMKPVAPTQNQIVVNSSQNQNLPVVVNNTVNNSHVINKTKQPSEISQPTQSRPEQYQVPIVQTKTQTSEPPIQPHELAGLNLNVSQPKTQTNNLISSDDAFNNTRRQIEQIKAKNAKNIKAHNEQQKPKSLPIQVKQTSQPVRQTMVTQSAVNTASVEPPIGALSSDKYIINNKKLNNIDVKTNKQTKRDYKASVTVKNKAQPKHNKTARASGKYTYVVQRNDNLWTIANEIAKRNKVSVATVMQQIHQTNPQAFINGDKSRIVAKSKLVLPDYKVVPSQKSLQNALAAKRGTSKKNVSATKKPSYKKNIKAKSSQSKIKNKKVTKSYKKPKVALVAPNKNRTNKKPASRNTAAANNQLITQLRSGRTNTANKVTRVNKLNSKVDSYTQKLQLQNKKLAELEARLKKLKGQ